MFANIFQTLWWALNSEDVLDPSYFPPSFPSEPVALYKFSFTALWPLFFQIERMVERERYHIRHSIGIPPGTVVILPCGAWVQKDSPVCCKWIIPTLFHGIFSVYGVGSTVIIVL